MQRTICLPATMWLCLLLLSYAAFAQPTPIPLHGNPSVLIYPNDNPHPLPCPPEPPADPERDLVVTWGPEVQLTIGIQYGCC